MGSSATTGTLSGRVVLLTGVTAGIGRATLIRLSAAGALVVGCARDERRLAEVGRRCPEVDLVAADVRREADRERLVRAALERHGRIDALVTNAGVGFVGLVEDMAAEHVRRVVETNVIGVIDLTRLVLPHLLAEGGGDVVVVSSVGAWASVPPLTVYCATKYAVDGFVVGLRREVGRRGVRVSTVNPGPVRTEWLARSLRYQPGEADPGVRLSPGVDPDRVARAVERVLLSGRSRTTAVPRAFGLARAVGVQPLRLATDVVLGLNAQRIGAAGRRLAYRRTPALSPPP